MGSTKVSSSTNTQPSPTDEALSKQNLKMLQYMEPYQKEMYSNLSSNINSILTGKTPMAQGIGGISDAQSQRMATSSVNSLYPQFQKSGLMDSGIAMSLAGRTYADTLNSNAQFNVSAAQNLFNIATGGQSNLQGQGTQLSSVLGTQLAGMRGTTGTTSYPFNGISLGILGKWGSSNYAG